MILCAIREFSHKNSKRETGGVKVVELAKKRDEFLKKSVASRKDSFDDQVLEAVKRSAASACRVLKTNDFHPASQCLEPAFDTPFEREQVFVRIGELGRREWLIRAEDACRRSKRFWAFTSA